MSGPSWLLRLYCSVVAVIGMSVAIRKIKWFLKFALMKKSESIFYIFMASGVDRKKLFHFFINFFCIEMI